VKPKLTAKAVANLRSLCCLGEAEAEAIADGTDDQKQESQEVLAAVSWVRRLCAWYDMKHKGDSNAND
jgi:hypothetical protein